MRAQIEALAQRGAPNVADLIENDRQIVWPTQDAEIDTEADDVAALTHAEREKREVEALGDLLAVERDEAAFAASVHRKPTCKSRRLLRRA